MWPAGNGHRGRMSLKTNENLSKAAAAWALFLSRHPGPRRGPIVNMCTELNSYERIRGQLASF